MKNIRITPWGVIVGLLMLIISVVIVSFQVTCDDHWWHMATGRMILANGSIPHTDPFSFTFGGKPWINWEWLSGVIMFMAWDIAGPGGLVFLRLLVALCSAVCIWRLFESQKDNTLSLPLQSLVLTSVLIIIQFRLADRPHTYAFALLAIAALLASHIVKTRRTVFIIPFIMLIALWVNVHPSWMLALAWFWAMVADALWREYRDSGSGLGATLAKNRNLLIASVVLPFGALLTPNLLSYAEAVGNIFAENTSPEWYSVLYWGPQAPFTMLALAVMVIGWVGYCIKTPPRQHIAKTLLLGLLFIQGMRHIRFIVPFAILVAPYAWLGYMRMLQGAKRSLPLRTAGLLAVVVGVMGIAMVGFNLNHYRFQPGIKVDDRANPIGAAAFMDEHHLYGKTFASTLQAHGYLSFRLWPKVTVFIDGRSPQVYSTAFRNNYSIGVTLERFKGFLETYSIQNVLVVRNDKQILNRGMLEAVDAEEGFGLAYVDDTSMLFRRFDPADTGIWKPFRILKPWMVSPTWMETLFEAHSFDAVLCEVARMYGNAPDAAISHVTVQLLQAYPKLSDAQRQRVGAMIKEPGSVRCE